MRVLEENEESDLTKRVSPNNFINIFCCAQKRKSFHFNCKRGIVETELGSVF